MIPLLTPGCPFFFFSLKIHFTSLCCCERPERYQRPPALRSPLQIFLPQLRLDFISNLAVHLESSAASECGQPATARLYRQAEPQKKVSLNASPYVRFGPSLCFS